MANHRKWSDLPLPLRTTPAASAGGWSNRSRGYSTYPGDTQHQPGDVLRRSPPAAEADTGSPHFKKSYQQPDMSEILELFAYPPCGCGRALQIADVDCAGGSRCSGKAVATCRGQSLLRHGSSAAAKYRILAGTGCMARATSNAADLRPGSKLRRQDSNLNCLNQNQKCCRLHHDGSSRPAVKPRPL